MDEELWRRVAELFHSALEQPEEEQAAWVAARSEGSPELSEAVLKMLDEDRRGVSRLGRGVAEVVGSVGDSAVAPRDPGPFLPPPRIGFYDRQGFLGRGGMGAVWRYVRTDTRQPVAIKFLRLEGGLPEVRRRRFAQEIHALARLRHPHIVAFHDAGELEDGTPWFVMDCVEEHTPAERFTDFARRPDQLVEQRLRLFRAVCDAVLYAHRQGIIHRDLKPSNILIDRDGLPRVVDFGIARELEQAGETEEATSVTQRFMSPDYAAPEWRREGRAGVYTDVYSLGVILYEVLTGEHPYRKPGDGRRPAGEEQLERLPEKPSALVRRKSSGRLQADANEPKLSRSEWSDLDRLCLTAMHPDPAERYPSVESLLRDVDHYLDREPLESQPKRLRYRAGKFVRRHRGGIAAATAGVALVATLIAGFTWRLAKERNAAQAEAARTTRIQHFMFDMLGNGDEEAGPASDLKVTALLDREAQQAGSLSADPQTQIDLYQTLGTMYDRLGKFDQSQRMLSLALDKARQTASADRPKIVEILLQMATLHGDKGDLKTAQQEVQQAIDITSRARLGPHDPITVQTQLALGRIYLQSGQTEKAIATLDPIARADPKRGEFSPKDVRDAVSALAIAQLSAQHYDLAEAEGQRAVDLDRKLLGESHPQTAEDVVNLASVKSTLGDLPGAETLYREGIAGMKSWYGPDHPDVATALSILARILTLEGKDAEAEPLLRDALRIQEKAYGPVHERVSFTLMSLGEIASRRGDLPHAEEDLRRAAEIDQSLFGDNNYKTAATRSGLGAVYLKESKNQLAEATLRQAVAALALLPAGNNLIGVARGRWGRALLALKRYTEANAQLTLAEQLLKAQHNPPLAEIGNVRADLAALSSATHNSSAGQE